MNIAIEDPRAALAMLGDAVGRRKALLQTSYTDLRTAPRTRWPGSWYQIAFDAVRRDELQLMKLVLATFGGSYAYGVPEELQVVFEATDAQSVLLELQKYLEDPAELQEYLEDPDDVADVVLPLNAMELIPMIIVALVQSADWTKLPGPTTINAIDEAVEAIIGTNPDEARLGLYCVGLEWVKACFPDDREGHHSIEEAIRSLRVQVAG